MLGVPGNVPPALNTPAIPSPKTQTTEPHATEAASARRFAHGGPATSTKPRPSWKSAKKRSHAAA
ncbi:MAG: hypothetical protein JRN58_07180 [Nitrososphaerota archaeon]|nr:hypothetical protein [Nitrososphaerota archaeon]MDG6978846.1 hypothetical protein [Nitrososphaerota archaeon]